MLSLKIFLLISTLCILSKLESVNAKKVTDAGSASERSSKQSKLHITVLYESLCPDSRRFMKKFAPVHNELKQYIDVQFVPFGKAYTLNNGGEVHCQHGPAECQGNRLQDCVLSTTKDQSAQTKFVVCQMLADTNGIQRCASNAGLASDVNACMNTELGTALQLESERITNLYEPTFIPTIVYNGVFNQKLQDRSIRDFRETVCNQLQDLNILSPNARECQ